MLPRTWRWNPRKEKLFFQQSKSWRGKFLSIRFVKSDQEHLQVAFSVTKKAGNAVERNAVRRIAREAVRQWLATHVEDGQTGRKVFILINRSPLTKQEFLEDWEAFCSEMV